MEDARNTRGFDVASYYQLLATKMQFETYTPFAYSDELHLVHFGHNSVSFHPLLYVSTHILFLF